ncbi:MAG: fibronectin type III domain-containing protein, partial [Bacteroidetes bacterium]
MTHFARLLLFFCALFPASLFSQDAQNRSVQVSMDILENPFRFHFSWPWDWSEGGYAIYKKAPDDPDWGVAVDSLPWGATEWTDANVTEGEAYEYAFFKQKWSVLTWQIPVGPGQKLRFLIQNSNGSGLCCNFGFGWYEVKTGDSLVAKGDEFEFLEVHQFEAGPADTLVTVRMLPDLLTNITRWELRDQTTDTLVAESGPPGATLIGKPKFGVIYAGKNLPPTEYRGTLLLLTDARFADPLRPELNQLILDLKMDGWRVVEKTVAAGQTVPEVKNLILATHAEVPDLRAIYLFGHIPVPYSGNYYADGHKENHWGAWVADTYYADRDGIWTDTLVENTSAFLPWNHNVPGDGKFDQSGIPSPLEWMVGRVDLTNLPAFADADTLLFKKYLDKAHRFKTGQIQVARRGLVDDNLGIVLGAPAASGYRNFAPLFGHDSIFQGDYFETLRQETYLFSYGGGGGTHLSADGIGTTFDFAADSLNTVFTMLFGSQFGDWDNENNFLRAPLAQGLTLANAWAGNPAWFFHHMAMGFPVGYSALRTQNAHFGDYGPGPQLVHTTLLGDPSLRLHPVRPPRNFSADTLGQTIRLNWSPPTETDILGYYVYETDSSFQTFFRLHDEPVTDTFFVLPNPEAGEHFFVIKTLKLEKSGSGTYQNLSLGIPDSVRVEQVVAAKETPPVNIRVFPNPTDGSVFIEGSLKTHN